MDQVATASAPPESMTEAETTSHRKKSKKKLSIGRQPRHASGDTAVAIADYEPRHLRAE